MNYESKIEKEIIKKKNEIRALEYALIEEKKGYIEKKEREGWKVFEFFSNYYGSHMERGDDDISILYLFHPEIDISEWEKGGFAHGSGDSQNERNTAFEEWLEALPDDKYVEC